MKNTAGGCDNGSEERTRVGQVHVGVMATVDTYSAANGYVFRKPIVEAVDTYVGMDFIILNTDIETIELMRTLCGDGGIQ